MILVDFSQTVIAACFSNKMIESNDENLFRHVALNTLRSYVQRYSSEYGQLVVCADGKNSWRKQAFPHYKASRAKSREDSDVNWKMVFDTLSKIYNEIEAIGLYPSIKLDGVEGDDVIAVLSEIAFRSSEKTLIISSDKDFRQLQKYDNIHQYSPLKDDFITVENASDFLMEHIIRGDSGDGIPNIFSDDDTLVDKAKRQAPATKKKIEAFMNYIYGSDNVNEIKDEWKKNYDRNKTLIDFESIPKEIHQNIEKAWKNVFDVKPDKKMFLDYLVKNRCKQLIESIDEFFVAAV